MANAIPVTRKSAAPEAPVETQVAPVFTDESLTALAAAAINEGKTVSMVGTFLRVDN
jgi:hypothetical protein